MRESGSRPSPPLLSLAFATNWTAAAGEITRIDREQKPLPLRVMAARSSHDPAVDNTLFFDLSASPHEGNITDSFRRVRVGEHWHLLPWFPMAISERDCLGAQLVPSLIFCGECDSKSKPEHEPQGRAGTNSSGVPRHRRGLML